ncbi:ABC transporter permease [Streptomyces sp. NL15-2K]|uniref:ABC transporter permease n=1 Tax=Streptomyces sp. NL15-2K TaxID=376149 RepID=UPI000F58D97D|nr:MULTISPECIES: ABC transporter permease [Actinomycetes]WKX15449.1 ABC transporter permease [Kutzneria buriramensis]GCB52634.1 dipeptide transport system permease protein dppB [Streptomyces sp. NL15-2K]
MILYVLRRLGAGLVLALLISVITFWLLSFSFDDVAASLLGAGATAAEVEARMESLGMDRPVLVQYADWLTHAVRGDLGTSYFTSEPVRAAVMDRLGVTLSVVVTALLITAVVSVALGVTAATRGGGADKLAQGISLVGYLVPSLLLAIALVYAFAIKLSWLPATGYTPFTENPVKWATSIVIPVAALMIAGIATLTAQVRGAMIDELRKDYVRTLRTRGLSPRRIVLRHVLRNAAGPALTVLSLEFLTMLGGSLVIENVFALPGFGSFAFNASQQGDIPVIMGVMLLAVLMVIVVNLAVDLLNGWLNPKVRVR